MNAPKSDVQNSIPVDGMTCFTCGMTVQSAVKKLPGLQTAEASAKNKRAVVSYDLEQTSLDQIVDAINQTGFVAKKGG